MITQKTWDNRVEEALFNTFESKGSYFPKVSEVFSFIHNLPDNTGITYKIHENGKVCCIEVDWDVEVNNHPNCPIVPLAIEVLFYTDAYTNLRELKEIGYKKSAIRGIFVKRAPTVDTFEEFLKSMSQQILKKWNNKTFEITTDYDMKDLMKAWSRIRMYDQLYWNEKKGLTPFHGALGLQDAYILRCISENQELCPVAIKNGKIIGVNVNTIYRGMLNWVMFVLDRKESNLGHCLVADSFLKAAKNKCEYVNLGIDWWGYKEKVWRAERQKIEVLEWLKG